MREYDKELAMKLMIPGEKIEKDGFTIEVKPVPDSLGEHMLDPRVHRDQVDLFEKKMNASADEQPDLEKMRKMAGGFNPNLNSVQIRTRYFEVETDGGTVPVWMYYPRYHTADAPALVYAHGGGFYLGSSFDLESTCRLAAEVSGGFVFDIDYDLAPEKAFPVQAEQCYGVLKWVASQAEEIGFDRERIFMGGDSAGGNLTAVTALMDRDRGTKIMAGQFLVYPVVIMDQEGPEGFARDTSVFDIAHDHSMFLNDMIALGSPEVNQMLSDIYVQGKADLRDPYVSPAYADAEDLPPALIVLSEFDGLRIEGEWYAEKLAKAGVPVRVIRYAGMGHGWFDRLGVYPQAEAAVHELCAFIRRGTP